MTTINDHYNVEVQSRFYAFLQEDREGIEPEALIASAERRKELKKEIKNKAKKEKFKEKIEEEVREKAKEKLEEEVKEKEEVTEKIVQDKTEELSREPGEEQDTEERVERSYRGRGGYRRGGRDGPPRTEMNEGALKSEAEIKPDSRLERDNRGRGGSKRGSREGYTRTEADSFNEEGTEKKQYGNNRGRSYRKEIIEEDSFNKVGYFEEQSYSGFRGGTDKKRPYSRGMRSSRGSERIIGDNSYRADAEDDRRAVFDGTEIKSNRGRHTQFDRDNGAMMDENVDNTFPRNTRGRYPRSNRDNIDNTEHNNDRTANRGRYQRFNRDVGETGETFNDNVERTPFRGGRGRLAQSYRGTSDNNETYDGGQDGAPQRYGRGRYQRYNKDNNDTEIISQENVDNTCSTNGRGRYPRVNREANDNIDDVNERATEHTENKQHARRNIEIGDNLDIYENNVDNTSSRGSRGKFPRPNKGGLNRFSQPNNEEGSQFEHSRMGYFNENVDIREFRGRGRSRVSRGTRRGRGDYNRTSDQEHDENGHFKSDIRVTSPPPPIDNWEAVPDDVRCVSPPKVWPTEVDEVEEKTADWGEIEDDPAEIKVDCKTTMTLEEWKALNSKDRILNQTLDGKEIRKANDGQDVFSGMSEYRKGKCVEDVVPEESETVHESTTHTKIKKEIPLAVRFSRNLGEPIVIVSDRNTYDQGYVENSRTYQRSYTGRERDSRGGGRGRGRTRGGSDFNRYEKDGSDFNSSKREGLDHNSSRKEESDGSDLNINRRGGLDYNSGRRGASDNNSGRRGGSEGISGRKVGTDNSDFNSRGRGNSDNRFDGRDGVDQFTNRRGGSDFNLGKRGVSENSDNDYSSKGGSSFNSRNRGGSDFTSRNRGSDFNAYGRGRDFNRGRTYVNRNLEYHGNIKEEENVTVNINLGNEEEFPHLS